MKEQLLKTLETYIDRSLELTARNNNDEMAGRVAILSNKAKEKEDIDAAAEVMILAMIMQTQGIQIKQ